MRVDQHGANGELPFALVVCGWVRRGSIKHPQHPLHERWLTYHVRLRCMQERGVSVGARGGADPRLWCSFCGDLNPCCAYPCVVQRVRLRQPGFLDSALDDWVPLKRHDGADEAAQAASAIAGEAAQAAEGASDEAAQAASAIAGEAAQAAEGASDGAAQAAEQERRFMHLAHACAEKLAYYARPGGAGQSQTLVWGHGSCGDAHWNLENVD